MGLATVFVSMVSYSFGSARAGNLAKGLSNALQGVYIWRTLDWEGCPVALASLI